MIIPVPINPAWMVSVLYRFRPRLRIFALCTATLALLALSGCGDGGSLTEEEYLQRAQQFREAGNLNASSIELRNALQQNPDSAQARLLLGQVYVDVGNGAAAEKELTRALKLGMPADAIVTPLARALLLQRKYQEVLDRAPVNNDASDIAKASILALRGSAYAGLNKRAEARSAFQGATDLDKDSVDALVGLGRLDLAEGRLASAKSYLEQALAIAPNDLIVSIFAGDLAFAGKDYERSAEVFGQLVKDRPGSLGLRIALARAEIGDGKLDQAAEALAPVLKALPNHPAANYLRALIAFRQKDYQAAKTYVEKVLQVRAADLPSLLIGGASNYAVGELEQARQRLSQFLDKVPQNEQARRLLGATLLRLAQSKDALETLKPLVENSPENTPENAKLLAMIGTAAIQAGDLAAGSDYFAKALKSDPKNSGLRAQLGATKIALGDLDAGIADLEAAVDQDGSLPRAQVALVLTLVKARRYDEALAAAKKLQERLPDSPAGYTLAGMALTGAKRWDEAKKAFEKAMEIRPGAPDAGNNLASLALREGDKDKARGYLEAVLKRFPKHTTTLIRLARLKAEAGENEAAIGLLERAVESRPDALIPRVYLARAYLVTRRPAKALETALAIGDRNRSDPALLEIIGKAQMALGESSDAMNTFRDLVTIRPKAAQAQYFVGWAAEAARDLPVAEKALQRALELNPDHAQAKFLLTRVHIRQNKPQAEKELAELEAKFPDSPNLLDLRGVIAMRKGNAKDAARAFAEAQKKAPSTDRVLRLSRAQARTAGVPAGIATLEKWLAQNPADVLARYQLAGFLAAAEQWGKAKSSYEAVLERRPKSWAALNDLAWTLFKLGDLKAARTRAEQSLEISPNNPLVMDTLGLVLLKQGEVEPGARLLAKATAGMPKNRQIRYHFALGLSRQGKAGEARRVLTKILGDGRPFPERAEAEALLKQIGS